MQQWQQVERCILSQCLLLLLLLVFGGATRRLATTTPACYTHDTHDLVCIAFCLIYCRWQDIA